MQAKSIINKLCGNNVKKKINQVEPIAQRHCIPDKYT